MEKDNKIKRQLKFTFLFILLGITLFNFASASSDDTCSLSVSLINQDSYPAIPNDYVTLVFQITGVQNPNCEGAWFELVPSYPFSLDSDTWISDSKTEWMISYKLRVDKDALDGSPEIEIHYGPGYWSSDPDSYLNKKFNITVQDSRTNFDAVIQDSTNSEVSIAIANTGKYVANSVVVRIPKQNGFQITGTDGQMVGNLDSGDYTIVSFSVTSNTQGNRIIPSSDEEVNNNFEFDIYYTDSLGERRIVNMELPLKMTSSTGVDILSSEFVTNNKGKNQFQWSNWYTAMIILVSIGIIFFLYKKYSKKIKKVFHNNKEPKNPNSVPDWVKNDKGKKK